MKSSFISHPLRIHLPFLPLRLQSFAEKSKTLLCVKVLVVQLCLTLCGLMDCNSLLGPWNSSGKNTGMGCYFPPPGDLPDPGMELGSLALQADPLQSEPPRKPASLCT